VELLDSTGYLLARVGAGSRRLWARMLAAHDLTPHHFGILMVLDQVGTATQQQLSRAVGIDPRNAVPVIDALQQRDLVRREPDPADRRRHAVGLTAAGRAAVRELRRSGEQVEAQLLDVLSPAERGALHRTLRKLLAALDG
jgi:MarR family transcriptional regulator, lower aerobic nicotinate degradation pathway regulator